MKISEYLQLVRKKIERIDTLYHEARKLGQDERAQKLKDEVYEIGFAQYQFINKFREIIQKVAKKHDDPEDKEFFGKLEQDLGSSNTKCAEILKEFVEDIK